ncbi:hypothetical protein GOBAR_AA35316 [Gossypium barbadense]|uniref:Peptidase C1A papain C-terminal domain-containing protein n=1 Tax=Gossypium barbadense TaxID=3634 RepID=A0A2P5QEA4_GOSBA|nr:hypothetical protein GOBAR_DD30209 [Gossypium barbadense]PPR85374.1 hypothetical protein GOBAR_AA35316 [Gossypium barbadense]
MADYSRKYESKLENEKRLNIFRENLEYIKSFNSGGNRSFKLGLNEFADMTQDEFIATHTGYKMQDNSTMSKSTSFSETKVDGCFRIHYQNHGITTEERYTYQEMQGTCDTGKQKNKAATSTNYETLPATDEEAMLQAVTNQPVSVAIDGSGLAFQFFQGGVFNGDCGNSLTHPVTIVGCGTSEEGLNYWLVKSSWGETWGEKGYFWIERGVNKCCIAMKAS